MVNLTTKGEQRNARANPPVACTTDAPSTKYQQQTLSIIWHHWCCRALGMVVIDVTKSNDGDDDGEQGKADAKAETEWKE